MFFHVFGHIKTDKRTLVAERAKKQERTHRPVFILEPGTRAADGFGYSFYSFALPNNTLVQIVLHMQQAFRFRLRKFLQRNVKPLGNNRGNVLLCNLRLFAYCAVIIAFFVCKPHFKYGFLIAQLRSQFILLARNCRSLFLAYLCKLAFFFLHGYGKFIVLQFYFCAGLVHQVNGFVRQVAVGNIAVGKLYRRFQRRIGNMQFMEFFIFFAQAF